MSDGTWRSSPPEVCAAKVLHAHDLLEQTRVAMHRWLDEVGERDLVVERQDQPGSWLIRVPELPEPLMEFGILVSDVVHNLRSALDHLAAWAVERNGGTITRDTAFPTVADPQKWPKEARTKLSGASPRDVKIIESYQPFSGHSDLLVLHDLSRLDKHRHLVPMTAMPSPIGMTLLFSREQHDQVTAIQTRQPDGTAFQAGEVMARVEYTGADVPAPTVSNPIVFTFGVLEGGEYGPTLAGLAGMCVTVLDVRNSLLGPEGHPGSLATASG